MNLSDLLVFDDIVIQCHDNPDADAIASGFGVYTFFKAKGKKVRFIYSGRFQIQKSNLVLMKDLLEIPLEYVEKPEPCKVLVTVDCQYGEGNITHGEAETVAVIDHHQVNGPLPEMSDVRSGMGSCSTIVWDMLRREGMDVNENENLATALYYGLYTDTSGFAELFHPKDKDLRDEARFNKTIVRNLRNSNLSFEELRIAGDAMTSYEFNKEFRFAMVKSAPCDPNVLGVISDMLLEVDLVRTCVVYSILPFGVKISVRSCVKDTKASDLAEYLCEGVGGGGGHIDKAGGFIQLKLLGERNPEEYLRQRMEQYFRESEVIEAAEYEADISSMEEYEKLPIHLGYVKASDVAEVGTLVCIRTLEGDVEIAITEDLYIIIGIDGEVYPNREEKFLRSYKMSDEPYVFEGEYAPEIKDIMNTKTIDLTKRAKTCISTGTTHIYAKPISHITKIFTAWDQEKYMRGKPGDYIAVRTDDYHDVYIIEKGIFGRTYKKV